MLTSNDRCKLTHLDLENLAGRSVILLPYWDGERWREWIPTPTGLQEIAVVDVVQSDYFAAAPVQEGDILIPFVDLMWQRASWPEIVPLTRAICDAFHKLGVSVAKLRSFFDRRATSEHHLVSAFASTELEYIVVLARSIFDLLQESIANIWNTKIRLLDSEADAKRRRCKLTDKFSKVVLEEKSSLRSANAIEERFGLPAKLAEEYVRQGRFFSELRDARDEIVHGGTGLGIVYDTERGFCVSPEHKPFKSHPWTNRDRYNQHLVSLLPWVASTVVRTVDACNAIASSFATVIQLPSELAPGCRTFVRGPSGKSLTEILKVHLGADPWWGQL